MIFSIVRTGWLNLRRDRAALILSFVVPVVFFSVFAGIFRGNSKTGTTRQIPVVIVDEDRSANSARFIGALRREKGLKVIDTRALPGGKTGPVSDAAQAEEIVRAGDAPLALVVPKGFGATPIRFFSAVTISTNWLRRVISASSSRTSFSGTPRGSGRTRSPNSAITPASTLSVFASLPIAFAKSLTCRGFTTATGSPARTSAIASSRSYPPVASITISCGRNASICSRISWMPSPSLRTVRCSPP